MEEKMLQRIAAGELRHIAFIMDGNGRWAKARGLSRGEGHRKGAQVFEEIAEYCGNIGIRYVTVYAFSTENWKRPPAEIRALLRLFSHYLDTAAQRLAEKKLRVIFLGDRSVFSKSVRKRMEALEEKSAVYDRVLNIAFNYGGRAEIVHACQAALSAGEEISEETLGAHLYTKLSPDPDLIVRTAGEMRLSNFLLWQAAYAEFYATDTLWPDMTPADVDKACAAYFGRKRNFGALPGE